MKFEMQKGFGLLGILIALTVVVLATGGGLYYYRNQQLATNNLQQAVDDKSVVVNESAVDTSSWKTYRNEQYGLEFKYPSDWKIIESDPSPTGFQFNVVRFYEKSRIAGKTEEELETVAHRPNFEIYLINGRPMALDQEWVNYDFGSYELTDRKKLLGGKDWTIIKCVSPSCKSRDNAVYLLEAQTIGVSLNNEDVLSTLKFIK